MSVHRPIIRVRDECCLPASNNRRRVCLECGTINGLVALLRVDWSRTVRNRSLASDKPLPSMNVMLVKYAAMIARKRRIE